MKFLFLGVYIFTVISALALIITQSELAAIKHAANFVAGIVILFNMKEQ